MKLQFTGIIAAMAMTVGTSILSAKPEKTRPPSPGGSAAAPHTERDPATAAKLRAGGFGFTKILVTQRNPLNPTHVYTYHEESLRAGGGLWICDFAGEKPEMKMIVDSSMGEILDASLHYDGETVLFSWKRTMTAPFQLHTVKLDGSDLTQVTDDAFQEEREAAGKYQPPFTPLRSPQQRHHSAVNRRITS